MKQPRTSARVIRLQDLEAIPVAGGRFQPVRRALGVRAFGINAYAAALAGDQLIEPHDETGSGAGGQEEAYIVLSGGARFVVDDEEIEAAAGTIVFVPDVAALRSAVATEPDTTAVVVGGPADRPLPVSPFEYWFVAEAPYRRGDYRRAIEIVSEGLEYWPDHPVIHYQLACYLALAGDKGEALDHLEEAVKADAGAKQWARDDRDLDPIRDAPRFVTIVS